MFVHVLKMCRGGRVSVLHMHTLKCYKHTDACYALRANAAWFPATTRTGMHPNLPERMDRFPSGNAEEGTTETFFHRTILQTV